MTKVPAREEARARARGCVDGKRARDVLVKGRDDDDVFRWMILCKILPRREDAKILPPIHLSVTPHRASRSHDAMPSHASTIAFRSIASTTSFASASRRGRAARPRRTGGVVTFAGPFDWLQNNKDVGGRDTTFEAQQEILRKRRSGANLGKEVAARRAKVSRFVNKKLPAAEQKAIEEKNRKKANALSKEAVKGGIPLPMASFGMPEFDGGERFDLRGKYVDEGWVDPEDAKRASGGLFGGVFGKKEPPKTKGEKPKKKGWF